MKKKCKHKTLKRIFGEYKEHLYFKCKKCDNWFIYSTEMPKLAIKNIKLDLGN